MKEATIALFWAKVRKTDGCWEWTAATTNRDVCNYGVFSVQRRSVLAHRFSYEIAFGAIPAGMKVCHRCDNGICVKPSDLFLGTQADNVADMYEKGRAVHATQLPLARKLSLEIIEAIRQQKGQYTQRELARMYSLSQATISNVILNRTWAD